MPIQMCLSMHSMCGYERTASGSFFRVCSRGRDHIPNVTRFVENELFHEHERAGSGTT